MRRFDYRAPRFQVNLPVRLTLENSTWIGRCKEISIEGMLLETRVPLSLDATGVIHAACCDAVLDVPVRVAHCSTHCEGLQFQCESAGQQQEVERFVERLVTTTRHAGPERLS